MQLVARSDVIVQLVAASGPVASTIVQLIASGSLVSVQLVTATGAHWTIVQLVGMRSGATGAQLVAARSAGAPGAQLSASPVVPRSARSVTSTLNLPMLFLLRR